MSEGSKGEARLEGTKQGMKRSPINIHVCQDVSGLDLTLTHMIAREPVASAERRLNEKDEEEVIPTKATLLHSSLQ